MVKRWVRQELKKNEIADVIEKLINLIKRNKQTAYTTGAIVLVLAVFIIYALYKVHTTKIKAWENLAYAQSLTMQNRTAEADRFLTSFISNYSTTKAAVHAAIELAVIKNEQSKYDEAVDILEKALNNNKDKTLEPFILSSKGFTHYKSGDYDSAIQTYTLLNSKYPDHWMAPSVHLKLAECYAKTADMQNAQNQLERILTLYPGSEWAEIADSNIKSMSNKPDGLN